MTSIRALSNTDLEKVQSLAHQIWPIAYASILSKEQLDYMLNWMYSLESLNQQIVDGHCYFGIFEEDEMLGFLDIEFNCPIINEMKINKIYVLTDQHGKGLGFKLIDFAIQQAKNHNMKMISLQVNRFNKAVDFYKKVGFKIREEKDFDIGNGFFMNDYVMEYPISE